MGFLRRLLGAGSDDADGEDGTGRAGSEDVDVLTASEATFDLHAERQRVTVWLRIHDPAFENVREQQRVFALENSIMRALDASAVGEHDTNAIETDYFAMRLVGDDADAIVAVVLPLLEGAPPGSYLAVRRGPAGSAEDRQSVGGDGEPDQAQG